jgi:hypothetical protein
MAVETGTEISDFNPSWPLSSHPRSEGDDHLRLIKAILQNDATSLAAALNVLAGNLTVAGILNAISAISANNGIHVGPASPAGGILLQNALETELRRDGAGSAWLGLQAALARVVTGAAEFRFNDGPLVPETVLRKGNVLVFQSPDFVFSNNSFSPHNHLLGGTPDEADLFLRCVTTEFGWPVGAVLKAHLNSSTATTTAVNELSLTTTSVELVTMGAANTQFVIRQRTLQQSAFITNANWRAFIVAKRFVL